MTALPVPSWLSVPRGRAQPVSDDVAEAVDARRGDPALARDVAAWAADDFRAACAALLERGGGAAPELMHAALGGLARGAARDAFAYAGARKVGGRPLIERDLAAARLSAIATEQVIAELQLERLLDPASSAADRDHARTELERSARAAVVESAHVHGGHGFLRDGDAGARVAAAVQLLAHLGGR